MGFDIRKYIEENKFDLGTVKKEVGNSTYKGGHNDLRKTEYDVKLTEDGKLDLYTHKEVEATYTRKQRLDENTLNEENHPLRQVNIHAGNITTIKNMMVDTYMKKKDPAIHLGDLEKEAKALLRAIKKAK